MTSQKGALTPLALQNADVLRALKTSKAANVTAFAAELDRDPSNLRKSLKALEAAGLTGASSSSNIADLTDAGVAAVAALDRAEGLAPAAAPAGETPQDFALLPLRQIFNDPLNPRKHFEDDAIAELAASIATDGLLENLVVRRDPAGGEVLRADEDGREVRAPIYRIVAGERRWRAMNLLVQQDRWDRHADAVPCKIIDIDDAAHRRIALVENLQRKDLRPIDEATALQELMKVTGKGTAEVAEEIGFTQRFVQQRLQLLALPDDVQTKVNAGDVSIEQGRKIAALLPDLPPAKAKELTAGKITPEEAKSWLEHQPKLREDITPRQWLILLEIADTSKRAHGEFNRYVGVGPEIEDDADWAALKALGYYFVNGPYPDWECGFQTGRRVSLDNYGDGGLTQLRLKYGDALDDEEARWRLLAQLRADAGVEYPLGIKVGEYAIPWLQGPFDVPEEIQQKIAQAKADRAAAEARQAEAEREAARRKGEAFNVAQSILVQHRKAEPSALDPRFAEAFAVFDVELPVTVAPSGDVLDAQGRRLVSGGYHYGGGGPPATMARNTLLALAVNAAAGLHTPDHAPAQAAEPMTREAFLRHIAGCLVEDMEVDEATAATMAERGLEAHLEDNGITFGDDDFGWAEDDAQDLAQMIREDDYGQPPPADAADAPEPIPAEA